MRNIVTSVIVLIVSWNCVAQSDEVKLKITPLTGDFYIFETFSVYKGQRIPANGMYLVTTEGAIMFDTPWDTTQFQPLLDSIKIRHKKNVVMAFASHFHEDRTGGLEYYRQRGIKTYTTKLTDELSKKTGKKRAEFLIAKDTVFRLGNYSFQTYHPGHGHTADNIVFWLEKEKILYGGCLIKSTKDTTLGNLADADVKAYATTLANVQKKCKDPKFVIPGHGDWSSVRSVQHTFEMAEKLKQVK
jgi:metallo-beta-lactamase class B